MKLRHMNKNPGSPNFDAVYASGFAFLTAATWPGMDGSFLEKLAPGFMGFCAVAGYAKAIRGFHLNYNRRVARENALQKSVTLGAARWASMYECQEAKLHDLKNTFLIGASILPLTLPRGTCVAVEASRGTGKSSGIVSLSILQALFSGSSVVVQDIKFEFFHLWADVLMRMGFRVYVNNLSLNPDYDHQNSNPFQPVIEAAKSESSQAETFIIAEALARTLIKDKGDAKSKYFVHGDRSVFVATVVGLAVLYPERCYPGEVYRTIFHPRKFRDLMVEARASDKLEGDLSAIAAHLLEKSKESAEHLENFRTGASNPLSLFRPSSELGSLGASHEFDAKTLRDPKKPPAVLFDLLPGDRINVFGPANALLQTSRLQSLRRHKDGRPVLYLIDEGTAAPVPEIVEAIEQSRSWNIDILIAYQSYASLVKTYGNEQAQAILSNCAEIYFSVSNYARAEEISKRIGNYTVKTTSQSFDENGKPGTSYSETSRPLMSPDEILTMPKNEAILLYPGLRPVKFKKTPWFEVEPFKHWAGDNPHERGHKKSTRTWFSIQYGKDAHNLTTPQLAKQKQYTRAAHKVEKQATKLPRIKKVRLTDFVWVPALISIATSIFVAGTPHLLLGTRFLSEERGPYVCTYWGLSGLHQVQQTGTCSNVHFIRFQD